MTRKTNLDMYRNLQEFKENVKTEQQIQLKLTEATMLMDNVKGVMRNQDNEISSLNEKLKALAQQTDLKHVIDDVSTRYDDLFSQMRTIEAESQKRDIDISDRILKDYITVADLQEYSENVQNTIQDFIVGSTPRIQPNLVADLTDQIQQLTSKLDVLYSKFDTLKIQIDQFDLPIRSQQKPNEVVSKQQSAYIDPLSLDPIDSVRDIKQKSRDVKIVPNLNISKRPSKPN